MWDSILEMRSLSSNFAITYGISKAKRIYRHDHKSTVEQASSLYSILNK
ncbi:MAG: hypothetical protein F6K47_08985 [Symploca sp. SIO2E6]|nr:hypothetical protein [Symploca sp. SIO2E6]